jgi:O-antigen ligase
VGALTAGAAYRALEEGAAGIYAESGQGDLRLMLWQHGLQALGASPLVGLGPGSHSGYTGPFQDFEAHNTYIDWASSTGLAGLVAFALLLVWTARRTGGDARLLAALLALLVVSVFGFYMRHPTFWFYLAAIALANPRSEPAGAPSAGAARAPVRPQPLPAGAT